MTERLLAPGRLPSGIELCLACEVVRVNQETDESQAHPRGIAVRFQELDSLARQHLEAFTAADVRQLRKDRPSGSRTA